MFRNPSIPARDWPIPPMDHGSGHKDTAFTWAMGDLILRRMGARETMRQITADPAMPAYCTVYRWVKVVPEFGERFWRMREALAEAIQREAAELRALKARARDEARRAAGKRVRTWVAGRKSSYTPELAFAVCWEIEAGASLSEVAAMPGMPSLKVVYTWLRRFPEFKAAYVEACRRREFELACDIDEVIDLAVGLGPAADIPGVNAEIARLEGRIGRLTPKIYRTLGPRG